MTDCFVADAAAVDIDALRASGHSVCRAPMRTHGLVRGPDGGLVPGDIERGRAVMVRAPGLSAMNPWLHGVDSRAVQIAQSMARRALEDEWDGLSKIDARESARRWWWR